VAIATLVRIGHGNCDDDDDDDDVVGGIGRDICWSFRRRHPPLSSRAGTGKKAGRVASVKRIAATGVAAPVLGSSCGDVLQLIVRSFCSATAVSRATTTTTTTIVSQHATGQALTGRADQGSRMAGMVGAGFVSLFRKERMIESIMDR
jgi:hypothetical protein